MQELLNKIGWTQAAFAKQIGTSRNTASRWCSDGQDTLAYRLAMKYLELVFKTL